MIMEPGAVEQVLDALGNCLAVGYAANAMAAGVSINDLTIHSGVRDRCSLMPPAIGLMTGVGRLDPGPCPRISGKAPRGAVCRS